MSASSEPESEPGFTTVVSRKKSKPRRNKRQATEATEPEPASRAPAPKATAPTAAPRSQSPPPPLMGVRTEKPDASPMDVSAPSPPVRALKAPKPKPSTCDPKPVASKPPPPIFVRDIALWETVSSLCKSQHINYTQARNTGTAIRVTTTTPDAYRRLIHLLRDRNVPYHTYALPEERKVRAVLRGIPEEVSTESVKADLIDQGFPVEAVYRMGGFSGKQIPNLALVVLTNCEEARAIYKSGPSSVCGLLPIKVEVPRAKGFPAQCHRCQLYGHAAANCTAPARCVKCLAPHATRECTRTRDDPTPPACVLCGQSGHTANYRGCPRAPKPRPPTKRGPAQTPSRPAKPVPPPRTAANFPALPKTKPATETPAPAAWGPKKSPPAQTASTSFLPESVNFKELTTLINKYKKCTSVLERLQVLCDHSDVVQALA